MKKASLARRPRLAARSGINPEDRNFRRWRIDGGMSEKRTETKQAVGTGFDGVSLYPGLLDEAAQQALVADLRQGAAAAPPYRPRMPRTGQPWSIQQTNFGPLGWVSDERGYRYETLHPLTGKSWPVIPPALLKLWAEIAAYPAPPECCLVNIYRGPKAKMGLHQDRDEAAADAPVVSISLGDTCIFRVGGFARGDGSKSFRLASGDVLVLGGASRLRFHGVDRIVPGSSSLLEGGGRLNLTLRRVTAPR
jgi:alkylated DNA repair protein (DNA oxidative demethylase)